MRPLRYSINITITAATYEVAQSAATVAKAPKIVQNP